MGFWGGMLSPDTEKHRIHPHTHHPQHLINHIAVDTIEPWDGTEGDIELTRLGEDGRSWLVTVHFKESTSEKYDYIYESEEEPTEDEVLKAIADDLLK